VAAPRRHHRAVTVHEDELEELEAAHVAKVTFVMAGITNELRTRAVRAWIAVVGDLDQTPTDDELAELIAITTKDLRRIAPKLAHELALLVDDAEAAAAVMAGRHLRIESGYSER
jgi:hypothetical protein